MIAQRVKIASASGGQFYVGANTKQQGRSAKALLAHIKAEGYEGGYSQLTAFIRAWRGDKGNPSWVKFQSAGLGQSSISANSPIN